MAEARTIVMKHNPGFLAAEDLIASFIARQAELETLLEIVRNNSRKSNQHVLVIGRRGMGKTMLVHRLALAIAQDLELSKRWYPLIFGEESYGVTTAGEFWLQALRQLAIQTGEARWREIHVELRREPDERRLHDLALARLLEFADERGVRLLVTVENLQDVLGVQMSEDDGWTLRHTLLNEPRIMLLATATNRFDDIDKPKAATYEMFRVLQLRPLEREECRVIWARLTGETLEGQMIRPIEIFTGGNPRLLTILGGFAKGRTLRELMSDLLGLIDDHSDYFKSNLEALSQEERRAFIALCELWEPSTARAVAEVARFDVNKASMCLGRLVNRGAVEVVLTRGKARYYQVAERLYNLFHRLRQSSSRDNRAASIVEFMMRFYGDGNRDAAALARRIATETCQVDSDAREDYLLMLHHVFDRAALPREITLAGFPAEFWRMPEVRKDPHLGTEWQSRYFSDLLRNFESASPGPFTSLDEADAPVLASLSRFLSGAISCAEFRSEIHSQVESRHLGLQMVCTVAWMVKCGDEDVEQAIVAKFEENLSIGQVHLIFGAVAMCRWLEPEFQQFAERHLLAAIDSGDDAIAKVASDALIWHYKRSGAVDSVVVVHEHMLARRPTSATHCEIGRLMQMNNPQRAEAAYRAALEISPQDRHATFELVRLLFRTQRSIEAVQLARNLQAQHPDDATIATVVSALGLLFDHSEESAEQFASAMQALDLTSISVNDLVIPLLVMGFALKPSAALPIAQRLARHASTLSMPESEKWFSELSVLFSFFADSALVRLAMECDAQAPSPLSNMHVKFALLKDGPEHALDILGELASKGPESLSTMPGAYRDTLMQLAAANPERLYQILAPIPLFEPFTLALAQELGHDVLAPYEVSEVAKDIRAEIRRLRGPTYVVDVPVLAAAEDAGQPRAKKVTARTSKTKTTKKATKKAAAKRQSASESGKRKAARKRT